MFPYIKATVASLAAISVGLLLYLYKRQRVYRKVGKVKQLYFFPLKSLRGIEVDQVECESQGIVVNGIKDRSFMLIRKDGVLISQREEPSLALLRQEISGMEIIVTGPDMEPLHIGSEENDDKNPVKCVIHSDEGEVVECGDSYSKWFQKYLKREDVLLVHYSEKLKSRVSTANVPFLRSLRKQNPIYLQDGAPVHVVAESSIHDLNNRLEKKVSVLNFRPSVYVENSVVYEEDSWKYIKFSSGAEIVTILPCGRCVLTTNNPETGVKDNKELLSALRKYRLPKTQELTRLVKHSPCFGIYCWLEKRGSIKIGDDIFAVVVDGQFEYKDSSEEE